MRKWIFAAGLCIVFSATAMAECPDLQGEYFCVHQSMPGTYKLTVGSVTVDGMTTYSFVNHHNSTKKTYIADGATYEFPDNGFNVLQISRCRADALTVQEDAHSTRDNFQVYTFMTARPVSSEELRIQVDYKSYFEGEKHTDGMYWVRCQRL